MKIPRLLSMIALTGCLLIALFSACDDDDDDNNNIQYDEGDESSAVERALWKALGKEVFSQITREELATVTRLEDISGFSRRILPHELELLAACVNLVELEIEVMQVSNAQLRVLAGLTQLQSLKLYGNYITDLSPLERLTHLRTLDISANPIADLRLRPVVGLPNLTALSAAKIRITDLRPLAGLVNLQQLELWGNDIDDIRPLAGLVNLRELFLNNNRITDLQPLSGLVELATLSLASNRIVDIKPLVDNPGLGQGDVVDVRVNRLSEAIRNKYIPVLEARGVEVKW